MTRKIKLEERMKASQVEADKKKSIGSVNVDGLEHYIFCIEDEYVASEYRQLPGGTITPPLHYRRDERFQMPRREPYILKVTRHTHKIDIFWYIGEKRLPSKASQELDKLINEYEVKNKQMEDRET